MNDFEIIMASITGVDKPGLTSQLAAIIAKYGATILDIGQADIHSSLSLGIMFKSDKSASGSILKEMLFKSCEMGVQVRFSPVSVEEYNHWVSLQGKNRHIVTLLGRDISASLIADVAKVLADQNLNIDTITRLTGRVPLVEDEALKGKTRACVEMSVRGTPKDKPLLHSEFMRLSQERGYDISFQEDNLYRRNRRLICFDMDSTLIQTEVIDELAMRAGFVAQRLGRKRDEGNRRKSPNHRRRGAYSENFETIRLQNRHSVRRFYVFWRISERKIWHRLCLCQRT